MTDISTAASHPFFTVHDEPIALYTVAQLRELESHAAGQLPANALMARAGAAAARYLLELAAHDGSLTAGRPVWLAAGPGNNGGDALVCAAALREAGVEVEVCMPVEVKPADARWALGEARAAGVPICHAPPASFGQYGWLVDGLFGIGLARPLDGVFAELATRISAHAREGGRVLALDVPSGLDSDAGCLVGGGPAVKASATITFIGAKPGLYMTHGRDLTGTIAVAPLGVDSLRAPASLAGSALALLNAPALFASTFPPRAYASHKGTFGTLAVVGGDTGMCGAPILAARAALYAGAGKVHVAFVGDGAPPYDPPHPELMLHRLDAPGAFKLDTMDALALGCGMGRRSETAALLGEVLSLDVPKLIDADALNLLADDTRLADALAARGAAGDVCVLTPHPLEAARLIGADAHAVQGDRLAAARGLARRFGAVVVLKGAGTLIAAPDGRAAVNPTGNAALATGGTGDVLGGIIGAFLAEGLPRYEAALAGVYLHGLAADSLVASGAGPAGLTAGELAAAVRASLNRLIYR